jgi:hypothetical protein
MTEEGKAAAQCKREYQQTEAAFDAVRAALVEKLFATKLDEPLVREKLYLAVQSLDAVRVCMEQVITTGEIERHVEETRELLAQ